MAARCVVGVDLGGTKVLAGLVDEELVVHGRVQRLVAGADQAELIERICDAVEEVRRGSELVADAVGFGIPCLIDQRRGMAVMAVNLPIADLPFRDLMSERLGLPVVVDNDANVAALAEHRYGAARGAAHSLMLTIGTGIGGGVIVGDELLRGATGAAGELGHMVIDMDGPPCQGHCPNHGCLESLASGTALARDGHEAAVANPSSALGRALTAGRQISGALVTELAHDGDPLALGVITRIGERLGVGICSLVNIFNPEVVVVGGGVLAAGELLLAPARAVVAERGLSPSRELARIVAAHFGPEAGMIGAATLALDAVRRPAGRAPAGA